MAPIIHCPVKQVPEVFSKVPAKVGYGKSHSAGDYSVKTALAGKGEKSPAIEF